MKAISLLKQTVFELYGNIVVWWLIDMLGKEMSTISAMGEDHNIQYISKY